MHEDMIQFFGNAILGMKSDVFMERGESKDAIRGKADGRQSVSTY